MEDDRKIEIDVRYEAGDFRRPRLTFSAWGLLFILSFFTVLCLSALFFGQKRAGADEGLMFYLWSPVALTAFALYLYLWPKWLVQRERRDGRDAVQYTLSADGIDVRYPAATTLVPWTAIVKSVETKKDFLLYFSPTVALPIPKRCLASPDRMAAFRDIVAEGVPRPSRHERMATTTRNVLKLLVAALLITGLILLFYHFANP
jgi:YcxB-like protein